MTPTIHTNPFAIPVAVVASFLLAWAWFGPLFGRQWAQANGFRYTRPSRREVARALAINLVATALTAIVLSRNVQVWRPSAWGLAGDASPFVYGFFGGFFVFAGYVLPMLLLGVAFERKPWRSFFVAAGYHFVSLQVMGMILSYWWQPPWSA